MLTDLATFAAVALGGVVRGVSGFGASMIMTPLLSLLLGPVQAVITSLLLETAAGAHSLPQAFQTASWRKLLPICIAAAVTVPIGGYVLVTLDVDSARRLIAAVVILFSLILLVGYSYKGEQRLGTSIALGLASGTMLGATGIGGPPVILYLISGPDSAATTRANLNVYISLISSFGLAMLAHRGLLTMDLAARTLLCFPVFMAGLWAGAWLFARLTDVAFRTATLVFMVLVSALLLAT